MSAPLRWSIVAAAFAVALWLPLRLGLTSDASWLLTVAERMLGGEHLYRDILENNPPFSIWLYTPPALAGDLTGFHSELFLYLQFILLCWSSFGLSVAILRAANLVEPAHLWIAALAWIVLFVAFPLQTFLQREHFAIVALMPWLALQVARWATSGGFRPRLWMLIAAGLACATIVVNKPFYILTVVVPVAALGVRQRSLRPLFNPENMIGATLTAAYGAVVLAAYPDYFGTLYETQKLIYMPVRTPEADILFRLCALAIVVALVLWCPPRRWPAVTAIGVLAALGHLAGTVAMGKTFTYHALPMMILSGFACIAVVAERCRTDRSIGPQGGFSLLRGVASALLIGVAFGATVIVFTRGHTTDRQLLAYLRATHPGATYISISPSLADSHPLVRLADGRYVGPHGALVMESFGAILLHQHPDMAPGRRDRILAEIDRERRAFASTILQTRPDVLLVSLDMQAGSDPAWSAIAGTAVADHVLGDFYMTETRIGGIDVMTRKQTTDF